MLFEISHGIFQFSILWLAFSLSSSLIIAGATFAAIMIPLALSRLFIGVIVDRYSKTRLMSLSLILMIILLLPIWILFKNGLILETLPLLLAYAFFAQLYVLSNNASIRSIVPKEQVSRAVSLVQVSVRIGTLVGFIVGGFLTAYLHDLIFIVLAAPYVVSLIVLAASRVSEVQSGGSSLTVRDYLSDLKQGLSYVRAHRILVAIMIIASILLFLESPFIIVGLKYVIMLGGDETMYGIYLALIELGALIGAIIFSKINIGGRAGLSLSLAILLSSLPRVGLGLSNSIVCALPLAFALGIAVSVVSISLASIVWSIAEKEIIGRVLGIMNSVVQSVHPVAIVVAGVLGTIIMPRVLFILLGAISALIGAVLLIYVRLRRIGL
ncbi:MAG: MFS transporter [Crenarchaeota archaeon]|nr:MFS transporter [Thermoproteota archaeon]